MCARIARDAAVYPNALATASEAFAVEDCLCASSLVLGLGTIVAVSRADVISAWSFEEIVPDRDSAS